MSPLRSHNILSSHESPPTAQDFFKLQGASRTKPLLPLITDILSISGNMPHLWRELWVEWMPMSSDMQS
eukprot:g393.t1